MPDSSTAKTVAAWLPKHTDLLQNVRTLHLQLDREAIDSCGSAAGTWTWGMLASHFAGIFGYSTVTATTAAAFLRSMPKTLSRVNLELQGFHGFTEAAATPLHGHDCAVIRSELATLPHLQSICIAGPGAAACLPYSPHLAVTFSQLTSLRLGTIKSHAEVAQLLQGLPASLQQLRLNVDTLDNNAINDDLLLELQRSVQLDHLTALTTLDVTGRFFMIGRDSKLPPSIINLTVPLVLHVKPCCS